MKKIGGGWRCKPRPLSPTWRDVNAVKALVADVKAAFGRIDILINSAGIFEPNLIGETTETQYDEMMDINVKGSFFTINEVAPIMIEQGGGKIVNLSSVTGVMGFKDLLRLLRDEGGDQPSHPLAGAGAQPPQHRGERDPSRQHGDADERENSHRAAVQGDAGGHERGDAEHADLFGR